MSYWLEFDSATRSRAIYPADSPQIPQSWKFPPKIQSQLTQCQKFDDMKSKRQWWRHNDQLQSIAAPVYIIHISSSLLINSHLPQTMKLHFSSIKLISKTAKSPWQLHSLPQWKIIIIFTTKLVNTYRMLCQQGTWSTFFPLMTVCSSFS